VWHVARFDVLLPHGECSFVLLSPGERLMVKGYGPVHDEWRSAEDTNTGGMELDVWRENQDQRKLKEMTE
jgi:hypothetical protein